MAIGFDVGLGDGPHIDFAAGVECLQSVHEGVAVVARAAVEGVEVRRGDGVELGEIVGSCSGVHGAHGFDDLHLDLREYRCMTGGRAECRKGGGGEEVARNAERASCEIGGRFRDMEQDMRRTSGTLLHGMSS